MSLIAPPNQLPVIYRAGQYLGTITTENTDAEDNLTTATDFSIPEGAVVRICVDAECVISTEFDASDITATNGEPCQADTKEVRWLRPGQSTIAVKGASGAVNAAIFLLSTRG